jgi:hypothetical protein
MIPGKDGYSKNRYFTSYNTRMFRMLIAGEIKRQQYQKIQNMGPGQTLFLNISHQQDTLIPAGYREVVKDARFEDYLNDGLYQSPLLKIVFVKEK